MGLNGILSSQDSELSFLLRALRYRNYRLFFLGQGISLIGTWMQTIALSWLVYRLTNSAFLLGLVSFSTQIPTFLFVPFAGVIADRFARRKILLITQTFAMVQAFLMAFLALSGKIYVWQLLSLSVFLGMVNAFDAPARQAFVVDMVEKREDLSNAIALNSLMFNSARLIGPAIAGVVVGMLGEGICFLLNGFSFLAVILALWQMRMGSAKKQVTSTHLLERLKEGLVYTYGSVPIRNILLLVTLISLLGMSYVVLMPIFAKDVLKGGPYTLGFLMGAVGIGALAGGIFLARRRSVQGLEKIIPQAALAFSFWLFCFSFSRSLWLSLFLLTGIGFAMIIQLGSSNTVLHALTDDDLRGRVMSFYALSFLGVAPFGSLLAGFLAEKIGAPYAVSFSGLVCILVAFAFSKRSALIRQALESRDDKDNHPQNASPGLL
jgi:MFS family permease